MSAAAAFFDVDGTIVRGDIVRWYVHYRTRDLGFFSGLMWKLRYLPTVARWIALDRVDRRTMNIEFYKSYRGWRSDDLAHWAEEDFARLVAPRIFAGARERVAEHQARKEPVVLVTGSLELLMRPLARHLGVDDIVAVGMESEDGVLTGQIIGEPLAGAQKARAVRAWAAQRGIDLAQSYAYGDSASDLPVLEVVGHAVAVNPDRKLAKRARARGWEVADWSPGRG